MTGAVLNALNTRLDAAILAFTLDHAETKLLITDREYSKVIKEALGLARTKPRVIDYDDPEYSGPGERLSEVEYEDFLQQGDPDFPWAMPVDEWDAIALNYTSGTTGDPKGVVYHHRGAYLLAVGNVLTCAMGRHPVYLWTLPMFHCNGWCFTWAVTAVGATHVCLPKVDPPLVWKLLADEGVTHMNGAPTVLVMLASDAAAHQLERPVLVTTAGAPPPPAVIERTEALGFEINHLYGLTETYGPITICEWNPDWDELDVEERARLKARQGLHMVTADPVRVVDKELNDVPADGATMGEVVMRGNNVMKGYFDDEAATAEAFRGGWFHSGDLGVMHPDGYVELRDRAKDIIISGGENISTIEVERALVRHPDVLEAAVVAIPDEKWGERPKAFVTLRPGATITTDELIAFSRETLAGFKVPSEVEFGELPKTSTGKIKKYELRERERTRRAPLASTTA